MRVGFKLHERHRKPNQRDDAGDTYSEKSVTGVRTYVWNGTYACTPHHNVFYSLHPVNDFYFYS